MSVLRATHLAKRVHPSSLSVVRQRRWASSGDHHHEDTHDSTVYPKEGFTGPFWRNILIIAGVCTGVALFAPSDLLPGASSDAEDAPWLTRVIAHNAPSKETWQKLNERHLQQTEQHAQNTHLVQNAKPSLVHRFRYTGGFDQVSAHRLPVGGTTDISDLEIKNDVV
ncbi:hypothetical protein SCHPADRAFT_845163 [Schizopora paradoxa]|uniref:Uncharacterized protein n=1 Tax=Schizopora paradoxa TaxID=27342 RepID=A0A0H2S272_9AGAM|nr:hypothetical protein SCHPADRAFT_845163 [Schizopora paradoxa]